MKAYQIKAIVKKSKPPVWSRCLIPAGITFSQLAVVLNEIFSLDMTEDFEYEFYQRRLQLREKKEKDLFQPSFHYSLQEASTTYIDDYLEEEKWFSFFSGREKSFRLEIERIVLESEYDSPMVVKAKGSEQDITTVNMSLQQKYSITYSEQPTYQLFRDLVMNISEGKYGLTVMLEPISKKDNLRQSADSLLCQFVENVMGNLEKQPEYQEFLRTGNRTDEINDELLQIVEAARNDFKEKIHKNYNVEMFSAKDKKGIYLRELLTLYSKPDLKDYAKDLHLRGYSAWSIAELTDRIATELLKESVMRKRMSTLTDQQMALFEKVLASEDGFQPENAKQWYDVYRIDELDYVYVDKNDEIRMPIDVKEAYQKINVSDFHKTRKQIVWLLKCLEMVRLLYAVAPLHIVMKMYKKRPGYRITMGEIKNYFEQIPQDDNPCGIVGDKVVDKSVLEDDMYLVLERNQGDKAFYIPTYKEIEDCVEHGYPSQNPSYKKLVDFFEDKMRLDKRGSLELIQEIYIKIAFGYDMHDVMEYLNDMEIAFPTEGVMREFVGLFMELNNNTRMVINRGHMPNEMLNDRRNAPGRGANVLPTIVPGSSLAAQMLQQSQGAIEEMGFHLDFSANATEISNTIVSNNGATIRTKKKKIYPNDPCPCGSGNKYKRCCGKR